MNAPTLSHQRLKAVVRGAVQGVGFRPFVYRLATELGLAGWVKNSAQGVFIEVEGERGALDQFMLRFEKSKPPRATRDCVPRLPSNPMIRVSIRLVRAWVCEAQGCRE